MLHHNLRCYSLLHPRLPSITPPEKWSTTRLRVFPQLTSPRLTITTLLQRTTPGPPNTTLHPTTHPQLRQYILTTQRPLHPTTVIRITTPRFAVYYTKIYAAPSYYTEAPVYYNTEAPEYYITTYASTPPTIPKLPSISLLRLTTPLRHLNITSQLMPLQLTSRILKPILNFCLLVVIQIRIHFLMRVIDFFVRILNTSKPFNIATYLIFCFLEERLLL